MEIAVLCHASSEVIRTLWLLSASSLWLLEVVLASLREAVLGAALWRGPHVEGPAFVNRQGGTEASAHTTELQKQILQLQWNLGINAPRGPA